MSEPNPKPPASWLKDLGPAMAVPSILVSGPLAGFLIGYFLDRRFGWDPWGKVALMVLGFVSSARECWNLIRRMQSR